MAAALPGCAAPRAAELQPLNPPVIELVNGTYEVLPGAGVFDSPVLSPAGDRLAVQIEIYRDPALPYEVYSLGVAQREADDRWGPVEIVQEGVYRPVCGRMSMPIQPSFDPTAEYLLVTQVRFDSILRIPLFPTLRSWVEKIPWRGGPAERIIDGKDWDLPKTELIQHARYSPDGRFLTFYTRVHTARQGVYLLDLKTGEKVRLGSDHDKHPTWSPDGRRIYFHCQTGGKRHRFDFSGGGQEQSVIGYYELLIGAEGQVNAWRRRLMDEPGGGRYLYQKHPVEVAGTGLLFCHGELRPDGKKRILVRRAEPGSQIYVLDPTWSGGELKEMKHPCASFERRDLMFIAKPKGGDAYNLLLALNEAALERIEQVVFAPDPTPAVHADSTR